MENVIESRDLGERDGFDLVAYKVVDRDADVGADDCYSEEDVAALRRGDWSFVGVVVTASREGVELGEKSLWAVPDGYSPGFVVPEHQPDGVTHAFKHTLGGDGAYDLPADALEAAKAKLAALRALDAEG